MEKTLIVKEEDLSLVEGNSLNGSQLQHLLKKTPEKYLKKRPAKGGGTWTYVTGGYVKKVLNLMFGWDWDFEILNEQIMHGEAVVKGRLTCRSNGKKIIKTQYGNKDIVYKKEPDKDGNRVPLSIGNDLKAAATDCLKKCAAEIGIAADVYNPEEFREIQIDSTQGDLDPEIEEQLQLITDIQGLDNYVSRLVASDHKLNRDINFRTRVEKIRNDLKPKQ